MRRRIILVLAAFQTLKANPLHTMLSILGLVIGVAALVAVLALGDGMERYARDQIETTTDLHALQVQVRTSARIDGLTVQRDSVRVLSLADVRDLKTRIGQDAVAVLVERRSLEITRPGDTLKTAAVLMAASAGVEAILPVALRAGRFFTGEDLDQARPVVVINAALARRLAGRDTPDAVLGSRIRVGFVEVEVVGVVQSREGDPAGVVGPITVLGRTDGEGSPGLLIKAHEVEKVPLLQERLETWMDARFAEGKEGFSILTNEARVAQVQRGVLLFKLVMGLITGISVVVGGVGVMNVLLMAVTERTREIGIRKATGARGGDIVWQFLVEALAISGLGSLLGLGVGLLAIFTVTPIIRQLTEVPFQAAFSWVTVAVVMVLAVSVGLVFGTYPAYRAARLSPVEAIRHE